MNADNYYDLILPFLEGDLTAAQEADFKSRMDADERLEEEVEKLRDLRASLLFSFAPETPSDLTAEIIQNTLKTLPTKKHSGSFSVFRIVSIAACFAVMVFATVIFLQSTDMFTQDSTDTADMEEPADTKGESESRNSWSNKELGASPDSKSTSLKDKSNEDKLEVPREENLAVDIDEESEGLDKEELEEHEDAVESLEGKGKRLRRGSRSGVANQPQESEKEPSAAKKTKDSGSPKPKTSGIKSPGAPANTAPVPVQTNAVPKKDEPATDYERIVDAKRKAKQAKKNKATPEVFHYTKVVDGKEVIVLKGGELELSPEKETTVELPYFCKLVVPKGSKVKISIVNADTDKIAKLPGLSLKSSAKKINVKVELISGKCGIISLDGNIGEWTKPKTYLLLGVILVD